jgi:hypothetical protein
MRNEETANDTTLRRLADQERLVARQRRVIARLEQSGHCTNTARVLLHLMEDSLRILRSSLPHFPT